MPLFGSSKKDSNEMAIVAASSDQTQVGREADVTGGGLNIQPYAGTNPLPQSKRPVSVIEMLEFVKSLEIDPVKESEMLWMAEEAFHAQLPPGWDEHTDEHGRVYFHNIATGESCWQHPMDELFKEIVDYWRRVQIVGGFWEIEDELRDLEDQIRQDLNDWMELFDEHGEKFFYNRRTEESRFDDPRNSVYHDLYQRIKMVAKMKERLPLLARAPRPEDPTEAELELQRQLEEEQERYLQCVLRIQAAARCLFVKRRVRAMRAKRVFDRGHQPLRGRLELRLERRGAAHKFQPEAVLAETGPHRRNKCATRIQSLVRGVQARLAFRPIVAHRAYMTSKVLIIQKVARVYIRKQMKQRRAEERLHRAATVIQRHARGMAAREYVKNMGSERRRFEHMLKCAIKCQTVFRVGLAKKKVQKRREEIRNYNIVRMQSQAKVFLAQKELLQRFRENNPVKCYFFNTTDEKMRPLLPWTWRLVMAPVNHRGQVQDWPHKPVNLFANEGKNGFVRKAVEKLQARVRGKQTRTKMEVTRTLNRYMAMVLWEVTCRSIDEREKAAIKIQTIFRGHNTRCKDIIRHKYNRWLENHTPQMRRIQAFISRFFDMERLMEMIEHTDTSRAVIVIQSHWRGYLARRQTALLREQSIWPLKSWFEYTPTGPDSVKVQVQFLTNPRFDSFGYFCKYGTFDELNDSLDQMDQEVQKLDEQSKTNKKKKKKGKGGKSRSGSRPQSGRRSGRSSDKSSSRKESARSESKRRKGDRDRRDSHGTDNSSSSSKVTGSKTDRASTNDDTAESVDENGNVRPSRSGKKNRRKPGSTGHGSESDNDSQNPEQGEAPGGNWSPRRGNLMSPDASPRSPKDAGNLGRAIRSQRSQRSQGKDKPDGAVSMAEAVEGQLAADDPAEFADPAGSDAADSERGSTSDKAEKPPSEKPPEPAPPPEQPRRVKEGCEALQVLADAAADPHTLPPNSLKPQRPSGEPANVPVVNLDELTEEQRIEYERQLKVAELVRRQHKHAAKRQKQKLREVEMLQQEGSPEEKIAEEHRRRKAKELKRLLRRLEEENLSAKSDGMKERIGRLHLDSLEKMESQHQLHRERRMRIAEQRRKMTSQARGPADRGPADTSSTMMGGMSKSDRVLHRHVHHHVHYHDGVDSDDQVAGFGSTQLAGSRMLGNSGQSASAIDLRSSGGFPSQPGSRAPTEGMPWRPLVHSASVGAVSMGTRSSYGDAMDMERTAETFKMPGLSPGAQRRQAGYGYQNPADVAVPAGGYSGGSGRQRAF